MWLVTPSSMDVPTPASSTHVPGFFGFVRPSFSKRDEREWMVMDARDAGGIYYAVQQPRANQSGSIEAIGESFVCRLH